MEKLEVLDRIIYMYGSVQKLNDFCEVRYREKINPLPQLRKDFKVSVYYNKLPRKSETAMVVWHDTTSNNVNVDIIGDM